MAATIRIFDTYSGTGTTTTVAAEVSRITGIRLAVIAISEIDKVLRERLQRRQHYERVRVFGDISDIAKGDVPPHHMIYDGTHRHHAKTFQPSEQQEEPKPSIRDHSR